MAVVLDASVSLAWCFLDEASDYADAALRRANDEGCVVPAIWSMEVANALLVAERRGRTTEAATARMSELLLSVPVEIEAVGPEHCLTAVLPLARAHGISLYDATYVELAARRQTPLATLDARLRRAAEAMGVTLVA
jgi:predicted nucleic acid-binding protein